MVRMAMGVWTLVVVVAALLGGLYGRSGLGGEAGCAALVCPVPPLCERAALPVGLRLRCLLGRLPLDPDSREYRRYVTQRLAVLVEESVKGQLLAPSVVELVRYKLSHPHEPMVLHFAGDNGVGKTRLAELISLSYAQRCGDALCTLGDSTLVLSGTGYDGMSLSEFRSVVVKLVVQHAERHPRDGVIIINELTSLEPEKVRVLLPLLGRSSEFPEFPSVKVSSQLVVLTTDFGREGRTRGKSLAEMRSFIDSEFKELYSAQSTSYVRTIPFLPISLDTAAEIVRVVVREIGCAASPPLRLAISDTAVMWLVEKTKATLSVENGRAISQETKLHVGSLVERLEAERERAVIDGPTTRRDDANCTVPDCTIFVDDDGSVDAAC